MGQCKNAVVKNGQYKNKLLKTSLFQVMKWNGDFQISISQLYVNGDLEIIAVNLLFSIRIRRQGTY